MQFAGAAVVVLEDNLWVWVGDESFSAQFLWHIEDIVDLDNAEVRVASFETRDIGKYVCGPSDVAHSGATLV